MFSFLNNSLFIYFIFLVIILIAIDKITTIYSLKKRNNLMEYNPLQKWFFNKFGLYTGSMLYGIISFIQAGIIFLFLYFLFGTNLAMIGVIIIYIYIIGNNIYWILKNNKN